MSRKIISVLFFVGFLFLSNKTYAESNVEEIVSKANIASYYAGNDGRAEVNMTITDAQGRIRKRSFVILRMDIKDGGEQDYFVYFKEPSDVRDMVYMVHKHVNADDDRWLYLPALDLVRRVASSDKRSSFVGSDFVYEDVSGRSIDLDVHELVEETEDAYKIKNVPKDKESVDFKYYYVWIDKKNFMPIKAEYYDEQDKLFRTVEALEIVNIEGIPTVTKSKATNLVSGSNTVLLFKNVKYNIGLTEDIFTERYLRRPPLEWIE